MKYPHFLKNARTLKLVLCFIACYLLFPSMLFAQIETNPGHRSWGKTRDGRFAICHSVSFVNRDTVAVCSPQMTLDLSNYPAFLDLAITNLGGSGFDLSDIDSSASGFSGSNLTGNVIDPSTSKCIEPGRGTYLSFIIFSDPTVWGDNTRYNWISTVSGVNPVQGNQTATGNDDSPFMYDSDVILGGALDVFQGANDLGYNSNIEPNIDGTYDFRYRATIGNYDNDAGTGGPATNITYTDSFSHLYNNMPINSISVSNSANGAITVNPSFTGGASVIGGSSVTADDLLISSGSLNPEEEDFVEITLNVGPIALPIKGDTRWTSGTVFADDTAGNRLEITTTDGQDPTQGGIEGPATTCRNGLAIEFDYRAYLEVSKTLTDAVPAASGISGNYDLSYEIMVLADDDNDVNIYRMAALDSVAHSFGTYFVGITSVPSVTNINATSPPSANAGFNGLTGSTYGSGIDLLSGNSSNLLEPGQSFTINFTIEVNGADSSAELLNVVDVWGDNAINGLIITQEGRSNYILRDSDLDGITNDLDRDDDNDGILDTNESQDGFFDNIRWTHNQAGDPNGIDPTPKLNDWVLSNVENEYIGDGIGATVVSRALNITGVEALSLLESIVNSEYIEYAVTSSSEVEDMTLLAAVSNIFEDASNSNGHGDSYKAALLVSDDNFSTWSLLGSDIDHMETNNSTTTDFYDFFDGSSNPSLLLKQNTTYKFRVHFYDVVDDNPSRNYIAFDDFSLQVRALQTRDTDGDTTPDYLDDDSDGDTCVDAIEAGHTDPDDDGILGNSPVSVDSNGMVTGQGGYTGTNARVTAPNQSVTITSEPSEQMTTAGGNATFTVAATGTGLTYQWEETIDGGTSYNPIVDAGIYSGATSTSLTLTGVTATMHNYEYRAIITDSNNLCSPDTETASPALIIRPTITIDDVSGVEGTNLTFTITSSHAIAEDVVFDIDYSNITTINADYNGPSSITLPANATSITFNVAAIDDNWVESDQIFEAEISTSGSVNITDAIGIGTIIDIDVAYVVGGNFSVTEGGTIQYRLFLSTDINGGGQQYVGIEDAYNVDFLVEERPSSSDPATEGSDYSSLSTTVTFPANSIAGTEIFIPIPTLDDTLIEPTEEFSGVKSRNIAEVTKYGTGPSRVSINTEKSALRILDNDAGAGTGISFQNDDITVDEATGTATVNVLLTGNVPGGFTLDFTSTDDTAIAPGDYTTNTGQLTFAGTDGETQPVTITIIDDNLIEATERSFIDLSNLSTTLIAINDSQANINITDNDGGVGTGISFQNDDITVDEATGTATVNVLLTGNVPSGFTLDFTSTDDSAIAPGDYTMNIGQLTFAGTDGETQPITITIIDDNLIEATERVFIDLSNLSTTLISINDSQADINITDNDGGAGTGISFVNDDITVDEDAGTVTVNVVLSGNVSGGFTVDYTTNNGSDVNDGSGPVSLTATSPNDYTTTSETLTFTGIDGEIQPITIPIIDDLLVESNENFVVDLSNLSTTLIAIIDSQAVVTIEDNEVARFTVGSIQVNEDVGTAQVPVTYAGGTLAFPYNIRYNFNESQALTPEDYTDGTGTLNFSGVDGEVLFIPVDIIDDNLVEATEFFSARIAVIGTQRPYPTNTAFANQSGNVEIIDNDAGSIAFQNDDITVDEAAGTATVNVLLTGNVPGGFILDFTSTDDSAIAPDDYTANNGQLTFAGTDGETQPITITIIDDNLIESTERLFIDLTNLSTALISINDSQATINITDNEEDNDNDTVPDPTDLDDDNDGIPDTEEDTNVDGDNDPSTDPTDTDNDGVWDYIDLDADNDGIPDNVEAQTTIGYIAPNGVVDTNGLDTAYPTGLIPTNTDGVDNPDYLDTDSDNEGGNDTAEANITLTGNDTDNDGLDDATDATADYSDVGGTIDNPLTAPVILPDVDVDANTGGDVDFRDANDNRPDNDNDGMPDVVDFDDDNDGILDTDEGCGNLILNGSFERDDFSDGSVYNNSGVNGAYIGADLNTDQITSWDYTQNMDAWVEGGAWALAYHGLQYMDIIGAATRSGGIMNEFSQRINTVPGNTYTLSFYWGEDWGHAPGSNVNVQITVLDETNSTLLTDSQNTVAQGDIGGVRGPNTWFYYENTFEATSVQSTVRFSSNASGPNFYSGANIDFVSVTVTSPSTCSDTDNDGVIDSFDLDSDNDGMLDAEEAGHGQPHTNGIVDGSTGTDGIPDAVQNSPDGEIVNYILAESINDTDTIPDFLDLDADGDGIPDNVEAQTTIGYMVPNGIFDANGIDTAYPSGIVPINTDGTDNPDYLDTDSDNEGADDTAEANITLFRNDGDNDGLDGATDATTDYTDVGGTIDNPLTAPVILPDMDSDATTGGDVDFRDAMDDTPIDLDSDDDGILDSFEDLNTDGDNDPTTNPTNSDGDLYPDYLDIDSDNDGIPDNVEAQTTSRYIAPSLQDTNNNGLDDAYEIDGTLGLIPVNTDTEDLPDYLDLDSDNDNVADAVEAHDIDKDGAPEVTFIGSDKDDDGLDDGYEGLEALDIDVNDEIDDPFGDLPNTDGDGESDYRDTDDDGDGIPTAEEDTNSDGIYANDDENNNGIPNYLEPPYVAVEIFNVVTPNGDGVHDILTITGLEERSNNSIQIFNRWGILLYMTDSYNTAGNYFEGRSLARLTSDKEEQLPSGTYFYIFVYEDITGESKKLSGYLYLN